MEKFATVTGIAMPLTRNNVDTDQIIPAQFMKRITKTGYDDALFHTWRQDPGFILNEPRYADATILVAGAGFGSGSSREHAVWALRDYGFRAILSPRFADIFKGNAGKQGLLTAEVPEEDIRTLWQLLEATPEARVTVDLEQRTVMCSGRSFLFSIDPSVRQRLLDGTDDIDLTLRSESEIARFEGMRPAWMPRTLPARGIS